MNHIASAIDDIIAKQNALTLKEYAWLNDLSPGWEGCREDSLCRCRNCRPPLVERKWK